MTCRPHEPARRSSSSCAIIALWLSEGENTPEELEREARRLGSAEADRMSVRNALLGMVEAQAVLADGADGVTPEQRASPSRFERALRIHSWMATTSGRLGILGKRCGGDG